MREFEHHAPLQPLLLDVGLEHMLAPVRPHHGVRGGQIGLEREPRADRRVALAHDADVRVVEQLLLKEAGLVQIGKVADRELGLTRLQRLGRRLARPGQGADLR